jgi:hypothetical protein
MQQQTISPAWGQTVLQGRDETATYVYTHQIIQNGEWWPRPVSIQPNSPRTFEEPSTRQLKQQLGSVNLLSLSGGVIMWADSVGPTSVFGAKWSEQSLVQSSSPP